MTTLTITHAGPMVTLQDLGRPGYIAFGLSHGGAMDRLAVLEAAALLGTAPQPALELAGMGGVFEVSQPVRFALTGAPMAAQIDGAALAWNASHTLYPGAVLTIGGTVSGSYGYLIFAGGIAAPAQLGSVSAHLAAGLGARIAAGDTFALGVDVNLDRAPHILRVADRFNGGRIRLMPGSQTEQFDHDTRTRFAQTQFIRSAQANRQGVRLEQSGPSFLADHAASLMSDFITRGDVQLTGAGLPYVLMAECQTIGGYPRIGTVIAADMARVAQAPLGAAIVFEWITCDQADAAYQADAAVLANLRKVVQPLRRNPADIRDLLSYQLISGATRGDELEVV
jgi:biotin-dependent carboxylase-like uncharacterized protein